MNMRSFLCSLTTLIALGLSHEQLSAQTFEVVAQFPQNMIRPSGGLIPGPNLENPTQLRLYGVSEHGGTGGAGVLFSYEPATDTFAIEADFGKDFWNANTTGEAVQKSARVGKGEHRIVSIGGSIYGVTAEGGAVGYGMVWRWTPTAINPPPASPAAELSKLAEFDPANSGGHPRFGVVTDGTYLYGTCSVGGNNNRGTLWRVQVGAAGIVVLYDFSDSGPGGVSTGGVTFSNNRLYGLSRKYDTATATWNDLVWSYVNPTAASPLATQLNPERQFVAATDGYPRGSLASNNSGIVYGATYDTSSGLAGSAKLFRYDISPSFRLSASSIASPGSVSVAVNNNVVYGVSQTGTGADANGRLFTWNGAVTGNITLIKNFSTGGSKSPAGPVYRDSSNGVIYGTSTGGGTDGEGSLWALTPSNTNNPPPTGTISTVFECVSPALGGMPDGIISHPNGSIFGTEKLGESVWRWNPATGLERVASFQTVAQGFPPFGQMAVKPDGTLFGLTSDGGSTGDGTLWQWTQHGDISVRSNLGSASSPGDASGGMVMDANGNLFGISNSFSGAVPVTSLWRLTAAGVFSKLATFNQATHGVFSIGSLAVDDNGAVYGVCVMGGENDAGTVWKWAPVGGLTRLGSFKDGAQHPRRPRGGVAVAPDGSAVYGTSTSSGTDSGRIWAWTQLNNALQSIATLTKTTHGELIETDTGVDVAGIRLFVASAPIALSSSGTLYGATDRNGSGSPSRGCGTLWNYSTGVPGAVNVAKVFNRSEHDGARGVAALAFGSDGRLYGATDNALWRFGPTPSTQPPSTVTKASTLQTATRLTFSGVVHPHGLSTTITFEYGTSPNNLDKTVVATPGNSNSGSPVTVEAGVGFLNPDTTYYYRVAGTSSGGTSQGGIAKAKTAPASTPPLATTKPADALSHDMATIHGSINPNHASNPVDILFQWGLTANALTNSVAATPLIAMGTSPTDVTASLTGLQPHTKYYYRVVAAGDHGLGTGTTLSFTTSNRLPTGVDDAYFALPGAPVQMNVLANDGDPDGDSLTIKSFTQPPAAAGKVAKSGNNLVFTPATGFATFTGSATFNYTPQDSQGTAAAAPVTVTITKDSITIAPTDNLTLLAASTTYPITVDTGNASTPWKAVETSPFVTLSTSGGTGDGVVNVTVAHNTTKNSRTATIVIGGATHLLMQAGVVSPTLTDPAMVPPAIVSGTFSLPIHTYLPAPVYTASKLPPGLKVVVNPTTGQAVVQGKPDKAGEYDVTIKAVNAATNAGNAADATINFRITVRQLPDHFIGDHVATLSPDPDFNNNIGGLISFKVQSTGSFTGSVKLGAGKTAPETLTFTGRLDAVAVAEPNPVPPATSVVLVARKAPLPPLSLNFNLGTAADIGENKMGGTLGVQGDSNTTATISGWRNKWTTAAPATTLIGPAPANKPLKEYYTVDLPPAAGAELVSPPVPLGHGYTTFTLQPGGALAWATTLADGTTGTGSTFLSPDNQFHVWIPLYKRAVLDYLGSLRGQLEINRTMGDSVSGALQWRKQAQSAPGVAPTYSYLGGFDTTITPTGARYIVPTGTVFDLLDAADNANLDFEQGGIASAAQVAQLDQNFKITTANTAVFTVANNPCLVKLTINKSLGLMNGTFTLKDGAITRGNIACKGVLIQPHLSTGRGWGHFNLPQLPAMGTSTAAEPRLSGTVQLKPLLIQP